MLEECELLTSLPLILQPLVDEIAMCWEHEGAGVRALSMCMHAAQPDFAACEAAARKG